MLLFLGAGASKVFGIPDTKGFITEFESKIGENKIYKKLKDSFPLELFDMEVLMTVLDDLSKPEEELLSSIAPHTSRILLMLKPEHSSEVEYLIKDNEVKLACSEMLQKIRKEIRAQCLTAVSTRKNNILENYDKFFRALQIPQPFKSGDGSGVRYPELNMFTTNYDTCIETYFNARQIDLSNGISKRFSEYVFTVDAYSPAKSLELIKLHGSIDLFVQNTRIRFLGAGAMDTEAKTYLGEEYGPEFMIYPIESSATSEVLQSPHIELLHIFRERLIKSHSWIIIGSTLRDSRLASLMNDVIMYMKTTELPMVIHINPDATHINSYLIEKGYQSLAEIIQPMDGCFMDDSVAALLRDHSLRGQ